MDGQVMISILPIQTNSMNKTKFLTVGLVLLLLLNAITLFLLIHMHLDRAHVKHEGEDPANFIIEQLRLDANQQKQFADLRHQHQEFSRTAHEKEKELHDAYFSLLKTDNPDKAKVDSMTTLMAAHHKELEQFTFEHFQKLRGICRGNQKKLFDETIDAIAKMVGGGPPRPGRPPPH
jgi:Spy/CpxP family protein refolding chaperone